MATSNTAKGKIVRRLGVNIFANPKYDKILKKKPHLPGKRKGLRLRRKTSEFGKQLEEKQKIRFAYGLREKQFFGVYKSAKRIEGLTGDNMMILLERRLDNVVFRLGMAASRAQARQMVNHGHFLLNEIKANIPSMLVKEGDVVMVKDKDQSRSLVRAVLAAKKGSLPEWLSVDEDALKGKIERKPYRSDIISDANEQLVVEYYSR